MLSVSPSPQRFPLSSRGSDDSDSLPTKPNHYEILGVRRDASGREIEAAWKKLSMQMHPDRSRENYDENSWHAINEAYGILKDLRARIQYDINLDPLPTIPKMRTEPREYFCDGCSSIFHEAGGMERHTCRISASGSNVCHRARCATDRPDQGYFPSERALHEHWKESEIHGVCMKCRSDFRSKDVLRAHSIQTHGKNGALASITACINWNKLWTFCFS